MRSPRKQLPIPANLLVFHGFGKGSFEQLPPGHDGFLGSWSGTENKFRIILMPTEGPYIVFRQKKDPTKGLYSLVDVLFPYESVGRRSLYRAEIATTPTQGGPFSTKYPRNTVKLAVMSDNAADLGLDIWEFGISSQHDQGKKHGMNFFFTEQLSYQSKLFRDEFGTLVAPDFEGLSEWDDLRRNIAMFLHGQNITVPALLESAAEARPTRTPKFKANQGRVIWYNLAGNLGAIATGEGNARVHWSDINSEKRFRSLQAGQLVGYEKLVAPTDPRTSFKLEAKGVKAIS